MGNPPALEMALYDVTYGNFISVTYLILGNFNGLLEEDPSNAFRAGRCG
jgi:hypothetical protein